MKRFPARKAGFSLVEVVFALGVAVFCLMPIFALLLVGQTSNQDTIHQTTAASLATGIGADLRATPTTQSTSPYYSLPLSAGAVTTTMLLSAEGVKLTDISTTEATYVATVVYSPPGPASLNAGVARILISWPARPNQPANQVPVHYVGSFETVVGLDRY